MSDFAFRYHQDTLKQGKERRNPDGSITTVLTRGVIYKGKVYNLPAFDRETGKDLSEQEQIAHFWPFIKAGEVEGFPIEYDGDIKDHPANKAARKGHLLIDKDMAEWRKKYPDRFK